MFHFVNMCKRIVMDLASYEEVKPSEVSKLLRFVLLYLLIHSFPSRTSARAKDRNCPMRSPEDKENVQHQHDGIAK